LPLDASSGTEKSSHYILARFFHDSGRNLHPVIQAVIPAQII